MKKKFKTLVVDGEDIEKFAFSFLSDEEIERSDLESEQMRKEVLSKYPEFKRAIELHRKGLFEDAIGIHREILSKEPTFFNSLYELGVIFENLNDYPKAVEYLKQAEKHCTHPTMLIHVSLSRATAEKELGDYLSETDSKLALSHYANAEELYRQNLKKARLSPNEAVVAIVNYGNLCCRTFRFSRAHGLYLNALGIIRSNPELKHLEPIVKKYLEDTTGV